MVTTSGGTWAMEAPTIGPARPELVRGLGPAVVMAAGLGWIGGTYPWPGPQWSGQVLITAIHLVAVVLILVAVSVIVTGRHPSVGRVVLTALACAIKAVTVFAVVWAMTDPGGFGPHGFLDWVPIGMANAGGGLWLKTMIQSRHRARSGAAHASTGQV